jgi:hypothetical protein
MGAPVMKKKNKIRIAVLSIVPLLVPAALVAQTPEQAPTASELQKQLEEMRTQMNKLQKRIDEVEAKKPAESASGALPPTTSQQPAAIPQGPTSPHVGEATATYDTFSEDSVAAARYNNVPLDPKYHGYFYLPGTQTILKIGGYFKTDFMYDPKQAGNPDEFVTSSIPVPGVQGVHNSNVSIRPTRLSLDFRIPTKLGDARFYVEGDFFGTTSTTPRLRHAYAQVGNLLLGQTFTNFMDPDASPDTLDFEGPNGLVYVRSPQIRYGFAVSKRTVLFFSVEKPSSDLAFKTTTQVSSQPYSPSPDGTVRLRQEYGRGHWQVASVFRSVGAYLPNGHTDSVFGWGVNASGALRIFGRDNIIAEGTYGHGVARYIQDTSGLGIDAAVISTANPHLKATREVGTEVAYQHYWTKNLRSNVVYGYVQAHNTAFQPGSAFHKSDYGAGNLIWNPFGSLNVGAEFLYGWQVLKNGQEGNSPRIQFSAKYSFVKIDRDKK